jgi:hypothetical protein
MFSHDGLFYGKRIRISEFGFFHLSAEEAGADFAAALFLYDQLPYVDCVAKELELGRPWSAPIFSFWHLFLALCCICC